MKRFDVIIIGGGPGGSTLGAYLAKAGIKVAIFESEAYPRFHIGESLLPFSMDIFKETGFFEVLNSGKYIRKYGARFVDYRSDKEIYFEFQNGLDSEHGLAFEVSRAEFDEDLLRWAEKCGATIFQPETVREVDFFDDHVEITTRTDQYSATFVADATGRDCLIGKKLQLKQRNEDINNVSVFAHYHGVERMSGKREGDITIGLLKDQGWSWVIPFQGETTSVGVVVASKNFRANGDLDSYVEQTISCSEILQRQMSQAKKVSKVYAVSNYSHTCKSLLGDRWILVGDAGVFLDPVFSTGVHIALSSAKFSSEVLVSALTSRQTLLSTELGKDYESKVRTGVKRFHSLVRLFYDNHFIDQMQKAMNKPNVGRSFTSAIAGDVWNEKNNIFELNVL